MTSTERFRSRIGAAALLVCLGAADAAPAGDDDFWYVDPALAECFLAELDSYKTRIAAPMLVFLHDCPGNDAAAAFANMQQNNVLPNVDPDADPPEGFDPILVFKPDEFACLDAGEVAREAGLVKIPKHPRCE